MGVRGLEKYFTKKCRRAYVPVSIQEIAEEHRTIFSCEPVLVVDGMPVVNYLYERARLEWIYGGQWLQFQMILEDFIAKFKRIGVKLVFFFDGTIGADKRQEWIRRRISKYDVVDQIFTNIESGNFNPRGKFQLPTSMGTLARFALKLLKAEVYQTALEADSVIAEYAKENKEVFAILSQDSDFIIFNTKMYLSLDKLDLNNLETFHFDRECFAKYYLNLPVSQLPLFACLNGNDLVSMEKLEDFHCRMSTHKKTFLAAMAKNMVKLIHRKRWTGDVNNKREHKQISWELFRNGNEASLVRDVLKSYMMDGRVSAPNLLLDVDPFFWQKVSERHLDSSNTFIFTLMYKLEYDSSEVL